MTSDFRPPMTTVLFLCTANYYRSRLAEEIFNHYARERGLPAQAASAGIMADHWRSDNPGHISMHTLEAMDRFGISASNTNKDPDQLTDAMVDAADITIALSSKEHIPMIRRYFPHLENQIEFWEVEDVEWQDPLTATEAIHQQVLRLLARVPDPS